jgi:hypothetical protein
MDELSDCLHFALALTENQAKRRANTPNAVRANRISVSAGVNSDWRQTHPFMAGLYLVMGGLRRRRSGGGPLPGRCCFRRRILVNAGRLRIKIASLF